MDGVAGRLESKVQAAMRITQVRFRLGLTNIGRLSAIRTNF
jgi:hypothetical protein